jgi:hypothetical protein
MFFRRKPVSFSYFQKSRKPGPNSTSPRTRVRRTKQTPHNTQSSTRSARLRHPCIHLSQTESIPPESEAKPILTSNEKLDHSALSKLAAPKSRSRMSLKWPKQPDLPESCCGGFVSYARRRSIPLAGRARRTPNTSPQIADCFRRGQRDHLVRARETPAGSAHARALLNQTRRARAVAGCPQPQDKCAVKGLKLARGGSETDSELGKTHACGCNAPALTPAAPGCSALFRHLSGSLLRKSKSLVRYV